MSAPVLGTVEKLGVQLGVALTVGIIISWVVLCFQTGWLLKTTPYYHLDISLFQVDWKQGAVGSLLTGAIGTLSPKVADAMKNINPLQRKYTPADFQQYMCSLKGINNIGNLGELCRLWAAVVWSTNVMIFCIAFGSLFLAAGGVLLCRWAFGKPKAESRHASRICFGIACFLYTGGTAQYSTVTHYTNQMPPSNDATAWGPPVMVAILLTLLSFLPLLVSVAFIRQTYEEAVNENLSERKKLGLEQEKYGTMEAGAGAGQQVPQQNPQLPQQGPWPATGTWNQPTAPYPPAYGSFSPAPMPGPPLDGGASSFGLAPPGNVLMVPAGGAPSAEDGSIPVFVPGGGFSAPQGQAQPDADYESFDGPAPLRRGITHAMPAMSAPHQA